MSKLIIMCKSISNATSQRGRTGDKFSCFDRKFLQYQDNSFYVFAPVSSQNFAPKACFAQSCSGRGWFCLRKPCNLKLVNLFESCNNFSSLLDHILRFAKFKIPSKLAKHTFFTSNWENPITCCHSE